MNVIVFSGDITDASADVICTSTNPRLSLMMGTGRSVRERGGFTILRECERIVDAERDRSGRLLAPGTVHLTKAGLLPYKGILHCVASDIAHHSSAEVVARCVTNALAVAAGKGWTSIAIPLLASGHAHLPVDRTVHAIASAIRHSGKSLDEITIVVYEKELAIPVRELLRQQLPNVEVTIVESAALEVEEASWFD